MTATSTRRFQVFTDGGADPNPGPAGWGAVILDGATGERRELSGGAPRSTNNRMELTAAIRALEALPEGEPAAVHTDSIYLKKGITQWLPGWIARGWRRKGGALQNEDLWRELAGLTEGRRVTWHWLKGHAGHEHNERADELATAEIRALKRSGAARETPAAAAADVRVLLRVSGRPGGGGWAAVVLRDGEEEVRKGSARGVSANELELLAAAELLESLPEGIRVALYTGSDYLRKGASEWLPGWQRRGWTTKSGSPVQNREAWQRLARALERRRVAWPEVKGDPPDGWKELGKLAREAASS